MRQQIELGSNEAICQKWEESEKGWGTRPDGFSLHLSYDALHTYIKAYRDRLPDETPDEYSRPSGTPYPVGVSDTVIAMLRATGGSLLFNANYDYPGSGGIDGWLPAQQ